MIEQRDSKRHGIRYMVRLDFQGAKVTVGTYRTEREAKRAEREARNEIDRGAFMPVWRKDAKRYAPKTIAEPVRQTTVSEAVLVWLETKRNSLQPNSYTGYESAIRLHILPALGGYDYGSLTHDDVQRQVNDWRNSGMGARLLNRCVNILSASLKREVRLGRIPYSPVEGIEKPSARSRRQFTVWSSSQIDAFLKEAERDDQYASFWFLTLLEGMRRGEALGLRWQDLHWNEDESECSATIVQTLVPNLADGGAAMIQPRAKTRSSQRSVRLTAPTVAVLKAHRDRQRFERQRLSENWQDHDLIVTTTIGTPVTPSTIKRNRRNLVNRAGVPHITTHGLRHQAATIMLRAGVSPALVAQKLGHTDIGTTVDLYGHLSASDQVAANAALEAAYRLSGTD
jgi:integrase